MWFIYKYNIMKQITQVIITINKRQIIEGGRRKVKKK